MTTADQEWKNRGPFLLDRFLDDEHCRQIVATFETDRSRQRTFQGVVDLGKRDSRFVILPPPIEHSLCSKIVSSMRGLFEVDLENRLTHPPLLFCYHEGVGFVPHHDMVTQIELERGRTNEQPVVGGDFSVLLFPNDPSEYDGGELYFPDHGCEFKPAIGSLVAFPATRKFIHGVKPIRRGVRFSVLCRINAANNSPER